MWKNDDTTDTYNYNSITLKSILSSSNILNIKNENVDISVTNEGNINLNQRLEIDKKNNLVTIADNNGLVIGESSSDPSGSSPPSGTNGQMNHYGGSLYIYLNGSWRTIL